MQNENVCGPNHVGHVYILTSPNSEFIKIGGTDFPPMKRIREINACAPYRELGPWTLFDFRQVKNWRRVEYDLHYRYRSKLALDISGQRELFRLSPHEAAEQLGRLEAHILVGHPKIDRMFNDAAFAGYIQRLFAFSGMLNWLDLQGAWTFALFPSTSGGRYFTLNIDSHEVAYTTLGTRQEPRIRQVLFVDRLIYDFDEVRRWVASRKSVMRDDYFSSGWGRSTRLDFFGSFDEALVFLELDGVRRALIAYWVDRLVQMGERGKLSIFSRFHNWNAIAELRRRRDATRAAL